MNKHEEKQILAAAKNTSVSLSTMSTLCYGLAAMSGVTGLMLMANNDTSFSSDDVWFDLGIGLLVLVVPLVFKGFTLKVAEATLDTHRLIAEKLCEDRA